MDKGKTQKNGTNDKKLMIMLEALNLGDDINRLYVSRKGGRRLASIANCVDASIQGFEKYSKKNKEKLITTANNNNKKTTKIEWML